VCKKEINFLIYCIEIYRKEKKLTGVQTLKLFDDYGITDFILDCYEALHIEGANATIWQIDDFIAHHPLVTASEGEPKNPLSRGRLRSPAEG
jgi:hypothetical protein